MLVMSIGCRLQDMALSAAYVQLQGGSSANKILRMDSQSTSTAVLRLIM